jgi:hypothetical protein
MCDRKSITNCAQGLILYEIHYYYLSYFSNCCVLSFGIGIVGTNSKLYVLTNIVAPDRTTSQIHSP